MIAVVCLGGAHDARVLRRVEEASPSLRLIVQAALSSSRSCATTASSQSAPAAEGRRAIAGGIVAATASGSHSARARLARGAGIDPVEIGEHGRDRGAQL